jgi:hypothetical protein
MNRLILLVHHLVFLRGLERRLRVHAGERIESVMHHLRDLSPQVFDFAVFIRRPLHRREPRRDVADFLALIADAFEVGDGLDDGDDHAQIPGGRRPDRQYPAAFLIDRHFHAVDLVIVGRDRLAQAAIALDQGGDRLVQLLLHESAHLQHLIADFLQVFIEAARDVVSEVGGFHKDYLAWRVCYTRLLHANYARVHLHPIALHVNTARHICDAPPPRHGQCSHQARAASGTACCQIRGCGK